MKRYLKLGVALAIIALLGSIFSECRAAETPAFTLASPYVFTDEKAVVAVAVPAETEIAYELKTITRQGFGKAKTGSARVENGAIHIAPLTEGIHILEVGSTPKQTLRFLAFAPPSRLDAKALQRTLPQSYKKLMSGQPFRILASGDSVTATGDYESIVVKMLARATGNRNISFVDKSYSGRSIDASVREWNHDGPPNKPDLGLIMYGLNDQITNVPLDAFLEQYAWLTRELKSLGADCVWLQPTPDIGIPVSDAERKPNSNAPSYIVRTLGFGHALRASARDLNVPVAETFAFVWGNGGATLDESARAMWPIFPTGYSKQFESLLESGGKGDTIHPNVLGHLQIARAVFNALGDVRSTPSWQWSAQTRWTPRGAVSILSAQNISRMRRSGRLEVVSPSETMLESAPVAYDLKPGQSTRISVLWTDAQKPEDLLKYPADRYLSLQTPLVSIVDFSKNSDTTQSHVYGVAAPFPVENILRRTRQIVNGNRFALEYSRAGKIYSLPLEIPAGSDVGRIPILQKIKGKTESGWMAGEVQYVRFGAARSGGAVLDGDLSEWENAIWSVVGETVQARSWKGAEDNRVRLEDAYLRWAFKAGKDGIYLSSRATGDLSRDSFLVFFDTRAPELLGTPGRYYWVSGKLVEDGRIELSKGETSASAVGMEGVWKKTDSGANLEIFVPYAALDGAAWPQAGDLGLSIIWKHFDAAGKRTDLLWGENGHWWNPRWYGVVRRTDEANPQLPYRVRVH